MAEESSSAGGGSIGTARIDVTVNTATMESGVDAAKRKVSGLGAEAEAQFNRASASSKKYAESLLRQADLLGKTRAEQIAYNAQTRIGGELGEQIARKALANNLALEQSATAVGESADAAAARIKAMVQATAGQAEAARLAEAANLKASESAAARAAIDSVSTVESAKAFNAAVLQKRAALVQLDAAMAGGIPTMTALAEAELRLDAAMASGVLTEREQVAYLNAITAAEERLTGVKIADTIATQASTAAKVENAAATTLNSRATRELGTMLSELASGNYGRLKQSTAALANQTGLMAKVFTATGAAVVGVTAVVAALGVAFVKAEEDQTAFAKALLVTGNYANKTALQMEAMVGSIASAANVSQGSAREALQRVAETGRFTGAQFDLVAQAAAKMESATGQSIDTTIKKFEDLGKSPVDALLKLNDTEHFLTESQLERVRALVAEGNQQEAAAEAARIYAGRLDQVASAAEAARPHLSQMWKDAKDGASAAWEETKNFTEFLAAAAEKYKEMPWYKRLTPVGLASSLYGAEPTTPASVPSVAAAVNSDQARARIKLEEDASKLKDKYLTREEQKKREIAELDRVRVDLSEQEYTSLKKQIELRYSDKSMDKAAAKQAAFWDTPIVGDQRKGLADSLAKSIDGYKKEADQWARSTTAATAYKQTLNDMLETRKRAIDLQVQSIGMGKREVDQQQALIAIDEDYNRKKADLQKRQQNSTSALERDGYQQQLDDLKAYHDERVSLEKDGIAREAKAQADGLNGMKAAIADFMAQQQDNAGQMYDLTSKFLSGFSDAFADFATGAKSAKDAFGSLLDDMYRQALKFLANKAIQALFDSFSSTGGGTAKSTPGSSAGGWASIAGNLINAFSSSGGRATGGPVGSGRMYEVAENGPELLNVGSKVYLMMGSQSGHVTPIKDDGNSAGKRSPTYITNINVQPSSTRRTAEQVATATARTQRVAAARNG